MKRKDLVAVALSVLVVLGLQGPAMASTGGTPDGELHPNVGLILAYHADGNRHRCTATLVREDLLLTAAHCTDGVVGQMLVTFDSVIVAGSTPPETPPFPAAADPNVGYTTAELQAAGFNSGTPYTHPNYSHFADYDNWNDVGVVVLDVAEDLPIAPIAPLGTLDAIKPSDLSKTLFTAVGYGTEVRKPTSGPQTPQPMDFPLIRRHVEMPGQKLKEQILLTNGNDKDPRGTGGICFGDSGGPVFLDGQIVAVTSYALTDNCRYLSGNQRIDIAAAQDWLADEFGLVFAS